MGSNVDNSGARGSNAGDKFHELWALQQSLTLLSNHSELSAITLEGIPNHESGSNSPKWLGVDCALIYGAQTLRKAKRVELFQLKYSSASPGKAWSVSALCKRKKSINNSVIKRLADDFKEAQGEVSSKTKISVHLVSNQPTSPKLKRLLTEKWASLDASGCDKTVLGELKKLKSSSGLETKQFKEFLKALDFTACGTVDNQRLDESLILYLSKIKGQDDLSDQLAILRTRVRDLMQPERKNDYINQSRVLSWFNISSISGLFPCPSSVPLPKNYIKRNVVTLLSNAIQKAFPFIVLEGAGGCGKTTVMRAVQNSLPSGCHSVFFDCFADGSYLSSSNRRHRPENAFLQLINECSNALKLPFFAANKHSSPANINSFLERLDGFSKIVKEKSPKALLVFLIDAADNSVTAAKEREPNECTFVLEIIQAQKDKIPDNTRFVFSTRKTRTSWLELPDNCPKIACDAFSKEETKAFLSETFALDSAPILNDFQRLTKGNPRVQTYAIDRAKGDLRKLLRILRPGGKNLDDIFNQEIDLSRKRFSNRKLFESLIGSIAMLPGNPTVDTLAAICDTTAEEVEDLVSDIRGFSIQNREVRIKDEDFQFFLTKYVGQKETTIREQIAGYFFKTYKENAYSALNVAEALVKTKRFEELRIVIEGDEGAAVMDPVKRHQTLARRRVLAIHSISKLNAKEDQIKVLLLAAEQKKQHTSLQKLLKSEIALGVAISAETFARKAEVSADLRHTRGRILIHQAAKAALGEDQNLAREYLEKYSYWLDQRRAVPVGELSRWQISDEDLAIRFQVICLSHSPSIACKDLYSWKPESILPFVTHIAAERLVLCRNSRVLAAICSSNELKQPWRLFFLVAAAQLGLKISAKELEGSLTELARMPSFQLDALDSHNKDAPTSARIAHTIVLALEIALKLGVNRSRLLSISSSIREKWSAKGVTIRTDEVNRFDVLLRHIILEKRLKGEEANLEEVLTSFIKVDSKDDERTTRGNREIEELVKACLTSYAVRLQCLEDKAIPDIGQLVVAKDSYQFDHIHYSTKMRCRLAASIVSLSFLLPKASKMLIEASLIILENARFTDAIGEHRVAVIHQLATDPSQDEFVVESLNQVALKIVDTKVSASEKLEGLVRVANLLLLVSPEDSIAIFHRASQIVADIDLEVHDQIQFCAHAVNSAKFTSSKDARQVALMLAPFVALASEKLTGFDGFPWRTAIYILTQLDISVALATVSKWSDEGRESLDKLLNELLETALRSSNLPPALGLSCFPLLNHVEDEALKALVERIKEEKPILREELFETISKMAQIGIPSEWRPYDVRELAAQAPMSNEAQYPWTSRLKKAGEFIISGGYVNPILDSLHGKIERSKVPKGKAKGDFKIAAKTYDSREKIESIISSFKKAFPYGSAQSVLTQMRDRSATPKARLPFIRALASIPLTSATDQFIAESLTDTLEQWQQGPGVASWIASELDPYVLKNFSPLVSTDRGGLYAFRKLLKRIPDKRKREEVILKGLSVHGEFLDSSVIFDLTSLLVSTGKDFNTDKLLEWYIARLYRRVSTSDVQNTNIPQTLEQSFARFLCSLMSDIDTRIRWKAAHSLRNLFYLATDNYLEALTYECLTRTQESEFRKQEAPFYTYAVKLWYFIAVSHISAVQPQKLHKLRDRILDFVLNSEPHVAINHYAKKVLLDVHRSNPFSASDFKQIKKINSFTLAKKAKALDDRHLGFGESKNRKFEYDEMDTLPYWYSPVLRLFPTLSKERFFEINDAWIVEKMQVRESYRKWGDDPREARLDSRDYSLYTNDHGKLPLVERYSKYIELHSLYLTVGQALQGYPLINEPGAWEDWVSKFEVGDDKRWLSDERGPTPLDPVLWNFPSGLAVNSTSQKIFQLLLNSNFLLVAGCIEQIAREKSSRWSISTGLVGNETSRSLVRALQSTANPYWFGIPVEHSNLEIDKKPFKLKGWLRYPDRKSGIDDVDPYARGIRSREIEPGKLLRSQFALKKIEQSCRTTWISKVGEGFCYENWSDLSGGEYSESSTGFMGWRLSCDRALLKELLNSNNSDLIVSVMVNKHVNSAYEEKEQEKSQQNHWVLLLRQDGSVEDASGYLTTW